MKRFLLPLFLLILSAGFPSCASKKAPPPSPFSSSAAAPPKPSFLQTWMGKIPKLFPKKPKTPTATPPQWVGVIRMVNTEENFVLVESGTMTSAIPGETYLAVGKGAETASLRMTALKNPPFLIADILTGSPSAGEKIYLPKSSMPPPVPSPTPKARPTPKAKKASSREEPAGTPPPSPVADTPPKLPDPGPESGD